MSRKASGLRAWALQRLTAIYVALFVIYLIGVLVFAAPDGYAAWRDWLGGTTVGVAMLLFVFATLLHAWIGVRDVLIDYVSPIAVRAAALGVVALALVALGLWAAKALILAQVA